MEESGDVLRVMYLLSKFTDMALDGLTWTAARSAVDAVRFQPAHTKLLMACGASQADAPQRWVGGVAALLARPRVARWLDLPHRGVRAVAGLAARWLGPTASALVRFSSGAAAAAAETGERVVDWPSGSCNCIKPLPAYPVPMRGICTLSRSRTAPR